MSEDSAEAQRPALTHLEYIVAIHLISEMFRLERADHPASEPFRTTSTFLDGMREVLAVGIGASTALELPELRVTFTLVSDTVSVIRAERRIVRVPFGSEAIEAYRRMPGIDVTDNGHGTYEFRFQRTLDIDIISELREGLAGMSFVTLSDAEARRLGLLPPLVH